MKDPALVRDHALGDFWVRTRKAPPAFMSDLEWFVYDKDPTQGGKVLAHGRVDDTLSDKDADKKAGNAVVEAICRLTATRD